MAWKLSTKFLKCKIKIVKIKRSLKSSLVTTCFYCYVCKIFAHEQYNLHTHQPWNVSLVITIVKKVWKIHASNFLNAVLLVLNCDTK